VVLNLDNLWFSVEYQLAGEQDPVSEGRIYIDASVLKQPLKVCIIYNTL
jgi:hypothetical protein